MSWYVTQLCLVCTHTQDLQTKDWVVFSHFSKSILFRRCPSLSIRTLPILFALTLVFTRENFGQCSHDLAINRATIWPIKQASLTMRSSVALSSTSCSNLLNQLSCAHKLWLHYDFNSFICTWNVSHTSWRVLTSFPDSHHSFCGWHLLIEKLAPKLLKIEFCD